MKYMEDFVKTSFGLQTDQDNHLSENIDNTAMHKDFKVGIPH